MSSELERTVNYLSKQLKENKRLFILLIILISLIYLFTAVPEVGSVLIASYLAALLLEPWILALEKRQLSRFSAVLLIILCFALLFFSFIFFALPGIVEQILHLFDNLPTNIEFLRAKVLDYSELHKNDFVKTSLNWLVEKIDISKIDSKYIDTIFSTVNNALIGGYSAALTALNLFLFPFFVFYLSRDLNNFHNAMFKFFPELKNKTFLELTTEMLVRIRAFFKGQITVCFFLAGLYCLGFALLGLPSAFGVGILSGLLNVFPYVGLISGVVISTILVISNELGLYFLLKIYTVFFFVQLLEGNFITPKIVSDSVGLHPLIVMVALIIGGQIFGLIGLLIAIPITAILGVLASRAVTQF